jgi:two-component system, sensor histidine kinase and response regulator
LETLKLLVVDDEPGMRMAVTRTLRTFHVAVDRVGKEYRFELFEADSAEAGLAKIETDTPDIMLLDQKLPGMSGIDLMTLLAEMPDAPLVIMITAYATIETAIQATKKGAYDFLPKPFTPEELRNTVAKASEHAVVSREAARLARERRQVRFQFLSVLAHELKSPINAVQGFIDIMSDQNVSLTDDDKETILGRCSVRIRYMRKMIDDLLDLTRIESGQKKRELMSIDVTEIIQTAIESVSADAAARSIAIEFEPESKIIVHADQSEFEIVCNNLISNAVKYNRNGGTVKVTVQRDGDILRISVEDTGIGLSGEEIDRLFEDFVRIKSAKTRGIPGSGLGLSIVKKIAKLNGGDIAVLSTPDIGSTFTATMVLTSTEPAS